MFKNLAVSRYIVKAAVGKVLNSTSPVENFGLPATLGSGKWNLPFALPTASVIIGVFCTRVDAAGISGSAQIELFAASRINA